MLNYEASSLLTSICYCLLEAVYHEQKETTPPVISKIKEYLTENYADDLTLERLSQSFFLASHICRSSSRSILGFPRGIICCS
jgi:YesN/AraC family two-component response regulator